MASDPVKYCNYMQSIKERIDIVDVFVKSKNITKVSELDVEFCCLQFRIIFEIIVMSTIASHKDLFGSILKNISN
jgi:hypothetical protein